MRVKISRPDQRVVLLWTAMGLWLGAAGQAADTKSIHLRNKTIFTPSKNALQTQAIEPAAGLFLIQFNDRLHPAWREQLHAMSVELLRYVPDDAFIAQFNGASPGQVKQLPFVRWVGTYRPEHKLDSRLKTAQRAQVRVLLSPKAPGREQAMVRRS